MRAGPGEPGPQGEGKRVRWAKNQTRLTVVVATVTLVLAACGSDDDAADTTTALTLPPATTTTMAVVTTAPATTTTSTTTTTLPVSTTKATETVGSLEDWLAEVDKLVVDFGLTLPGPDDPPLPDVTNPDAAVALQSVFEFEWWTFVTAPSIHWADIYSLRSTLAWVDSRNAGSQLASLGLVFEFRGDPYVFHTARVVSIDESDVPPEAFEGLPDGSVVVEYESSVGPIEEVNPDTGEIWDNYPGWDRKPRYVIMSPTSTGWRLAWVGPIG